MCCKSFCWLPNWCVHGWACCVSSGQNVKDYRYEYPNICSDCCMLMCRVTSNRLVVPGSTLKYATNLLPSKSKATVAPAKFTFSGGEMYHWLHALIILILGCDVYKSGMQWEGTRSLQTWSRSKTIRGDNWWGSFFSLLFDKFKKTNNLTE